MQKYTFTRVSFSININPAWSLSLYLFEKVLLRRCFLDSYPKSLATTFEKKSIVIRNQDQISIANLTTKLFPLKLDKTSEFQEVKAGYAVLAVKRSIMVVNNTTTAEI